MKEAVGTIGGIKYGFKLFGYFLGVFFVGGIISVVGIGIVIDGMGAGNPMALAQARTVAQGPNIGQILVGVLISLSGTSVSFAGVVGAMYKVITDSAYTAQVEAWKHRG